jgi:hypothetical protein
MPDESPKARRAFVTRLTQLRWTPGERSAPAIAPFADADPFVKAVAGDLARRIDEDLTQCANPDPGPRLVKDAQRMKRERARRP